MSPAWRICARTFASIALLLLLSAMAASVAIHAGASEAVRIPFRFFCHGLPERCFILAGVPMPLCTRCVGLYAGSLLGILLARMIPAARFRGSGHLMFLAVAPLLIDGVTQALGLRLSNNLLRSATGLLAGTAFLFWVMQQIEKANPRLEGGIGE